MQKKVLTDAKIQEVLRQIRLYDEFTYQHSIRVSSYAKNIAERMGLNKKNIEEIGSAALIHDIGKILIPIAIIRGREKLTPEERVIVNSHPYKGFEYIKSHYECVSDIFSNVILQHHERIDGSGYPYGLKDTNISLEGSIVAVADVYDAMLSERTYKKGIPRSEVLAFLISEVNTLFHKEVVQALVNIEIQKEVKTG